MCLGWPESWGLGRAVRGMKLGALGMDLGTLGMHSNCLGVARGALRMDFVVCVRIGAYSFTENQFLVSKLLGLFL